MLVHAHAILPQEGQVEWTTPHHTMKMLHCVLLHIVTCYTSSIVSHNHVNTTKPHNITCTLVATDVRLRSLECNKTCVVEFELKTELGFKGQDMTSLKLGLTTPPAWMDVVGVHVLSRSAAQFAIHAAQYLPRPKNFNQFFFGLPKF
jgi:hypothetical protein